MAMEKQQLLEMDMDPTTFVCVNPYEVNPILPSPVLSVDVPLKGDNLIQQNWDTPQSGEFYGPQRKIKLEMEEFSDLSSFLLAKPMSVNSIDELNTPIFDKDAFDFNLNVPKKNNQSEELFVKLECDAYYENTCIITDNNQFKDFPFNTAKVHRKDNISSEIGNIMLQNSDVKIFSPETENESAYTCKISPSYGNTSIVDDNSVLSVNTNDKQYSYVSSSNEEFQHYQHNLETPDDSNSSMVFSEMNARNSHLALNVNLKPSSELKLNTPSIIEEVVDLESANFNILDLVPNEDIYYVSSEDIFSSTVTLPAADSVIQKKEYIPEKRPRKRRIHDDDDEDYIPPTKNNVPQRKIFVQDESESESESDAEVEIKSKRKPRGRPPKRTESVSSDCSKDSDASKYRELRDKNNEASRKSRLKRKLKDLELEKEAEELLNKNIKLRAQVGELEKLVTNFRDNLFKIMIKKER